MKLDTATLMWVIDNIGNNAYAEHENERGPNYNTLTLGRDLKEYRIFSLEDIRRWLADLTHSVHATFLPESCLRNDNEPPTHLKAACSCGWEDTVELNITPERPYEGFDRELEKLAGGHVSSEIEKIMERYQWDVE